MLTLDIYTVIIALVLVISMENTNMTIVAAVLVVGLLVGAGVGYYMAPADAGDGADGNVVTVSKNPLEGKTIQIGNIVASTAGLETAVPQYEDIVAGDINELLEKLNYDTELEFLIDTADGQAAIHLEKVQSFKAMDVSIFIGGGWSSQAEASRLAIAKALVEFVGSSDLQQKYLDYDRHLLVADTRYKETKKPGTHGHARSKRQLSFR